MWRERLGKPVQGLGADRLGAVKGSYPTAEIERGLVFNGDLADAEFVGEVWPAADRRPVTGDRPPPPRRTLQEGGGREERAGKTAVKWLKYAADQSHVVVDGKPTDAITVRRIFKRVSEEGGVMEQIAMAQHDALGGAGGA